MCETSIHALTNACRTYLDSKKSSSRTAPTKKTPCFDNLDKVSLHKPANLPKHLPSLSDLQNENLKNMEEEENLEMDLRIILLDSDEISMTVSINNINKPYISQSSSHHYHQIQWLSAGVLKEVPFLMMPVRMVSGCPKIRVI